MSGQAGGRGYLVQALVTVLDALKRDDWTLVEIEPNQADDKVDIRWSDRNGVMRVTQVKSSENAIQRSDVVEWLSDLIAGTHNAREYELMLLGAHSQGVVDLSKASLGSVTQASKDAKEGLPIVLSQNFHRVRIPPVRPLELETLNDSASERLEELLQRYQLDIPALESRRLIVARLITTFLEQSTNGIPISRADLEKRVKDWASNYVALRAIPLVVSVSKKYVQIAGSAAISTDREILRYSHQLVCALTQKLLEDGYGLVTSVGKDEVADTSDPKQTRLVFHWDILEAISAHLTASSLNGGANVLPLAKIVYSGKLDSEIPDTHRILWNELNEIGAVELDFIYPGWNAGAFRRMLEAERGDALVVLGGGEGVEHLALLYMQQGKPVIPLDLPIPSRYGDGGGGGEQLARYALSKPEQYIGQARNATTLLSSVLTRRGRVPVDAVCRNIVNVIGETIKPKAFYIHTVDLANSNYQAVHDFFQNIIRPFVTQMRYVEVDISRDSFHPAPLSLTVLKNVHYSSVVIADVTGASNDLLIALGYALGQKRSVIVTASSEALLPLDLSIVPCFRWDVKATIKETSEKFQSFWKANVARPPIIQPPSIP